MKREERIEKWRRWIKWVEDFPRSFKLESYFDELGNYRVELYTYDNDYQGWEITEQLPPINYYHGRKTERTI